MSGHYQMVILDEINVAVDFGLINLQDVLELIYKKHLSSLNIDR